MVEHDLAKVGVAGSSPVFRSSKRFLIVNVLIINYQLIRPDGGIGRRAGLKHQWSNPSRFDPGSGYYIQSEYGISSSTCGGGEIGRHATLRG